MSIPLAPAARRMLGATTKGTIAALLGLAGAGLVGGASPASAGSSLTFSVSPAFGPAGTVVHLQDVTPCPAGDSARGSVGYYPNVYGITGQPLSITTKSDGSWTSSFTEQPGTGPGSIQIACFSGHTDDGDYVIGNFDVSTSGRGYWLLAPTQFEWRTTELETHVVTFFDAPFFGWSTQPSLPSPPVAMAADPTTGTGYYLALANGGVIPFGLPSRGSLPADGISVTDIVGMAATPGGAGYWLVGSDGAVYAFGDAGYHGSLPGLDLRVTDIVGMAATPGGAGYWLVGSDGAVYAFGDAGYHGSLPGLDLRVTDIVGMAATPGGAGYWLAGSDGGVFAFGDVPFEGSMGGKRLAAPVVGIAAHGTGAGYWMAGSDGGVFAFGDAPFEGSCAHDGCANAGASPVFAAIAATPLTAAG